MYYYNKFLACESKTVWKVFLFVTYTLHNNAYMNSHFCSEVLDCAEYTMSL